MYAFRSFVPSAVWNLSDELPLHLKPVFAIGAHVAGIIGVAIVLRWRRRALLPLAIAFGVVTIARQLTLGSDAIGPYLAVAGWPLWLWLAAALANEVSAHDADTLVAPAFAVACALQLGMQSAWHGLDLASVRGTVGAVLIISLAVLLVLAVFRLRAPELARPHGSITWLLVGPALFLQMTFSANAGRMSEVTGLSLFTTVIVLQIGLLIALLVATRFVQLPLRVAAVVAAFIALFAIPGVTGAAGLIALAVPVVIVCALREGAERRVRWPSAVLMSLGALAFFALIFAFYNFYEFPPLWLLAFAPLAVFAALAMRASERPGARDVVWLASSCALTVLYVIPAPPARERGNAITVVSYNIHHGFDDDGMPGMQGTADEIAGMNPDLVALQEIGRGWTLLGGNDLIGYLRWRFPAYHVHYTPISGQLWGNAIMSRLPVVGAGGGAFDAEPRVFRYGWSAMTVQVDSADLSFYSVHLTANLEGKNGDPRLVQAEELQHVVRGRSPIVIAGDFNSHPNDRPIASFAGAYRDLGAVAGLADVPTWPATKPNERIDYVFGRGVSPLSGAIPRTTASDHLPVLLHLRIDDTTRTK